MAKQVSVRLVSQGGAELKAEFAGIGQAGEQAFRKIDSQTKSTTASAKDFEAAMRKDQRQVDRLKASLDPLHRSSMLYSQAVNQINASLAKGLIPQQEAIRLTDLAKQKFAGMSTGINSVSAAANRNSPVMRAMSLQLSQVAQQGAATGDYVKALAIQLPDLALGFGTVGILAGVAAGALLPLAVNALKGEEAVASLADTIDELGAAVARVEAAAANSGLGASELQQRYRGLSEEARDFFEIERQIAGLRAGEALKSAARSLAGELDVGGSIGIDPDQIRDASAAMDDLRNRISELDAVRADAGITAVELARAEAAALQDQLDAVSDVVLGFESLADTLGIADHEAQEVAARFAEIEQAEGARAQADAMISLVRYISDVSDNLSDAEEGGRELYDRLIEATQQALVFAGVEISGPVSAAAAEAERLAAAMSRVNLLKAQRPGLSGVLADEDLAMSQVVLLGAEERASKRAELANFLKPKKTRRGGGASAAQKEQNELMRDAERIYKSTRTEAEKFNEAVREADQLLASGLITQDTYNRHLEDLNETFRDMDGLKELREGIEEISDAIANAIVNGENLGDAMGKVFRKIASDLISSGIQKLLMQTFGFDGGGIFGPLVDNPFSLKQPTGMLSGLGIGGSFDGGGHTGSGPRTGGLDGKGGFLAMLHPQERIIDEYRGQGGGGVIQLVVRQEPGTIVEIVRNTTGAMIQMNNEAQDAALPSKISHFNKDPRVL
jgi:hypothetical protein